MSVTEAEEWAFEFISNQIRDRVESGVDTWESLAYNVFGEDMVDRGALGSRLYLTPPSDTEPKIFIEKMSQNEFSFVMEWAGREKYRDSLGVEFHDEVRRFLD